LHAKNNLEDFCASNRVFLPPSPLLRNCRTGKGSLLVRPHCGYPFNPDYLRQTHKKNALMPVGLVMNTLKSKTTLLRSDPNS
jgi:hypothetical protein